MDRYRPLAQEIVIYLAVGLIIFAILTIALGDQASLAIALSY